MIDIANEHLIPIREVPCHLPPRPTGRRIHISAVYRWLKSGVRGVLLESVQIGGSTYTSTEALQRFADRLGALGQRPTSTRSSTTESRRKQIEAATQEFDSILRNDRTGKPNG